MRRYWLLWSVALGASAIFTATAILLVARGSQILVAGLERIDLPVQSESEPVPFKVNPGESATTIAERLEKEGLIRSRLLFRLLASYYRVGAELEAGDYELSSSMTITQMIDRLRHGRVQTPQVTLLEGWRGEEMADFLAKNEIVDKGEFMRLFRGGSFAFGFLKDRPSGSTLEGYLFPDTYHLPPKANAETVIRMMLENFDRRFTQEMRQEAQKKGMSIHEVVTLASIVEREAVVPEERPIIASVYLNRLALGMPLAADPSVQYALANDPNHLAEHGYWKKELTEVDLQINSPYNTYGRTGLPPGPISSPGLASIRAVLEPAKTKYLYFVAKRDGSHAFSETLEEHLGNIARYR